ncbi:MAG: aminotransferase class I/II-fold pyridoxal phosphate-dependent enzyme [Verrucomicrobia bacterium]|nr:aminotransferase class I/II-fold pyridoxal phosphate-dependent enzyme [Verrucomicrobiota bacterium]
MPTKALDFTSALYLGLEHSSASLPAWKQFTLGKPAALESPPGAEEVAQDLAELQDCESATLGPSTLHLFLDLFEVLARRNISVFMDSETYPVARRGVERAAARRVPVKLFPHHSAQALRVAVATLCGRRRSPVVVTDGVCPRCNRVAPLNEYLDVARNGRGWLVVDDTQALGILGERPGLASPYGWHGGGSSRWLSIQGPELLLVSSLAKGFGAPIAALAGNQMLVDGFVKESSTHAHCSPPSIPAIAAAASALEINRQFGDLLRLRLLSRVRRLRRGLATVGLRAASPGLFPVQNFGLPTGTEPIALHTELLRRGIATMSQQLPGARRARLTVLLNARHTPEDIDQLVDELAGLLQPPQAQSYAQAEVEGFA